MHGSENLGGILHLPETCAGHLENGYLGRRSEAVLDAAQDAVRVTGVALELQDHVHDVLQDLRSGDGPVLGDVSDKDDGDTALLGHAEQGRGAFAHLGDG